MRRKLGVPIRWESFRVLTHHVKIDFSPAQRNGTSGQKSPVSTDVNNTISFSAAWTATYINALYSAFPGEFNLGSGEQQVRNKEAERIVKMLRISRKRSFQL